MNEMYDCRMPIRNVIKYSEVSTAKTAKPFNLIKNFKNYLKNYQKNKQVANLAIKHKWVPSGTMDIRL
jgi:hypothetical protein